jgi:hypothetical protein
MHHQQQIEVFEAVRQARQEAGAAPGLQGRRVRLAMHALMIRAGDVGGAHTVQCGQGQTGHGHRLPVSQMPGELGEEFSGERAEQALDLAPSLRARDGGIDKTEAQAGRDLLEMVAREVAAVIDDMCPSALCGAATLSA